MTPDELKAAWREQRAHHVSLPRYRNGYHVYAVWKDEWRVVLWLERGRAMARDDYINGEPVVVEEGEELAAALSGQRSSAKKAPPTSPAGLEVISHGGSVLHARDPLAKAWPNIGRATPQPP